MSSLSLKSNLPYKRLMTMLSNIFSCYTYYFNCSRSPLVLASFSFVLASFSFYSAIISIILSVGSYHEIEKELISFFRKISRNIFTKIGFSSMTGACWEAEENSTLSRLCSLLASRFLLFLSLFEALYYRTSAEFL